MTFGERPVEGVEGAEGVGGLASAAVLFVMLAGIVFAYRLALFWATFLTL